MHGRHFLIILTLITAVDLIVPYFLIGDIPSLRASFLFWTVLTSLVITFAVIYTSQWGKRP
ncbi:MAG: hypothetical protein ACLFUN_05060 [Desulfobacterales bacterium]